MTPSANLKSVSPPANPRAPEFLPQAAHGAVRFFRRLTARCDGGASGQSWLLHDQELNSSTQLPRSSPDLIESSFGPLQRQRPPIALKTSALASIVFQPLFRLPAAPPHNLAMLPRLAQASRLGLVAARLSRPVASPALRMHPTPAPFAVSPWLRTYASRKGPKDQPPADPSQSKPTKPEDNATEKKDDEQIAFDKLPDLTQGIPSTLEYELEGKDPKSQKALQESDHAESSGGDKRERPEYVSTSERNRSWWTRFMLASAVAGATGGFLYMGRDWDTVEAERYVNVPNTPGPVGWWTRAKTRMGDSVSYYQEPSFEKLLPDPDASFERPYTLCISLDDLLVHSEWSRDHGWRVAKRPGVDYFIRYLSQYYELVLFTTVPFATAEPLVRKLDPFRFIMWPLYREATKFQDGEIVKVGTPKLIQCDCDTNSTGPLLSEPRPLQGHHYRHQCQARPQPARERHCPQPLEG